MKTTKIILAIAAIFTVIISSVSSCKKTNQAPVIIISEPVNDSMIALTDSVYVEGSVSDDESLHEMSIVILKSTGDTALAQYPYVHNLKTYPFHFYFHPSAVGTYTLHVAAEDHHEAKTEKTVSIMVM